MHLMLLLNSYFSSQWCVFLSSVHWRRHAPVYPEKRRSTYHLAVIWDRIFSSCNSSRRLTTSSRVRHVIVVRWVSIRLWRFGFEVRGKGARPCRAWGKANLHNVSRKCTSCSGILVPTQDPACSSTCLVCRGLTSPGLRGALCHSPYITSQVPNQSPIVIISNSYPLLLNS